jgi:DNA-binding MarR family transcriptional regulator
MDSKTPIPYIGMVNTRYLEALIGYNARRAALAIIGVFMERMGVHNLRTVDFSVLTLIVHNPGITSRQLSASLGLKAPNLVGMILTLEKRCLIHRLPHPVDGRAKGLHPSPEGLVLMRSAEKTAAQLEVETATRLSPEERKTLNTLHKKVYK